MYYESTVYHIYNQSINYEPLFHSDDNYIYFLKKIQRYIVPYADVLCYCLMPDHFHLLVKPTELGCTLSRARRYARLDEHELAHYYQQKLSNGLRIMLSSYTRAFNRAYKRRGSLFRQHTKAKPGYEHFCDDSLLLASEDLPFTRFIPYLTTCFHYIHNNPVKANLVAHPEEWAYSSALDYGGLRDTQICNFKLCEKLLGITRKVY